MVELETEVRSGVDRREQEDRDLESQTKLKKGRCRGDFVRTGRRDDHTRHLHINPSIG